MLAEINYITQIFGNTVGPALLLMILIKMPKRTSKKEKNRLKTELNSQYGKTSTKEPIVEPEPVNNEPISYVDRDIKEEPQPPMETEFQQTQDKIATEAEMDSIEPIEPKKEQPEDI